jgi:hypothetical protein
MIAIDIMDNAIDLGATNTMLNANPLAGNGLVFGPLLLGARARARFLLRLACRDARRFVPVKARIFVHDTVGRKVIVLLVRRRFIVRFAGAGTTESFDLLGTFLGDDHVFDGMPLFLAAVELLLAFRIVWSLNGALGTVDNELQTGTGFQHLHERGRFPRRQLLLAAQRSIQHRGKQMNPHIRLRLTDAKHEPQQRLGRIEFEVKKVNSSLSSGVASVAGRPAPGWRWRAVERWVARPANAVT